MNESYIAKVIKRRRKAQINARLELIAALVKYFETSAEQGLTEKQQESDVQELLGSAGKEWTVIRFR